ncbi:MAG: hypothetical protein EOP09_20895 [Proteobacteria bacterium]|nr:MAG: hypothetical protein EOP09_20895 [Pseudomonadota bacterium]
MKSTTTLLLSLLVTGTVANAKVPLNEIEFLRKQTVVVQDLHVLDAKAQACGARVSCSAYETFVASAKVDPAIAQEIELVKAALDKNSATLTAKNYLAAWNGIPKPCGLLKQVLK